MSGCNIWEPTGGANALRQLLTLGWYEAHVAGKAVGDLWWTKNPATGRMTSWHDLSGNGRALTNAVVTGPWMTAVGSNTVARCVADSYVERNAPEFTGKTALTMVCVTTPTDATSLMLASWSTFGHALYHNANTMRFYTNTGTYGVTPALSGSPTLLTMRYDGTQPTDATRQRVRVNGAPVALTYVGVVPASIPLVAGTGLSLGDTSTHAAGFDFAGHLMAYCIVFRVLSDAEVLKAETALRQLIGGLP